MASNFNSWSSLPPTASSAYPAASTYPSNCSQYPSAPFSSAPQYQAPGSFGAPFTGVPSAGFSGMPAFGGSCMPCASPLPYAVPQATQPTEFLGYMAPPSGTEFPSQVPRPDNWLPTTFQTLPPPAGEGAPFVSEPLTVPAASVGGPVPVSAAAPAAAAVPHPAGPVKISYFPVKARGFLAMLVAELGGVPYEFVKVEMADWSAVKPTTPFGQVPVMEHGPIRIAQSCAIALYVARLAGMLGKDDADFAVSMMLVMEFDELLSRLAKYWYTETKAEDMTKYLAEVLPEDLAKLNKTLVSGRFTKEPTVGEAAIFCFLNIAKDLEPDCLDTHSGLKAFYDHFASQPKVSAFLEDKSRTGELWYKKDW